MFGSIGYAKSKLSSNNSLLSTQPLKVIAGVDYESPSENGCVLPPDLFGCEKAKDAQYTVFENTGWGTPLQEKSSGLSMAEQIGLCV